MSRSHTRRRQRKTRDALVIQYEGKSFLLRIKPIPLPPRTIKKRDAGAGSKGEG